MEPALESWVDAAPPHQKEFRQAARIILSGISSEPDLRKVMIMKGGLLLAIRYRSSRFTKDIDFSSTLKKVDPDFSDLREILERALAIASAESPSGIECRVQGVKLRPKNPEASFPAFEINIGYAVKGSAEHKRLLRLECPRIISLDLSLNEDVRLTDELAVDENSLRIYGKHELIAEKYRALLQQVERNRYRRQDVYDLNFIITPDLGGKDRASILEVLQRKCLSRGIVATRDSLGNEEIYRRAESEYGTLKDEVGGDLPPFDESYQSIRAFYESLPWEDPAP